MKIKVVGYLDSADLPPNLIDVEHETGLSDAGFMHFNSGEFTGMTALTDVEFTADHADPEPADRAERYAKKRKV